MQILNFGEFSVFVIELLSDGLEIALVNIRKLGIWHGLRPKNIVLHRKERLILKPIRPLLFSAALILNEWLQLSVGIFLE